MSFEINEIGPCKKRAEFELSDKDVQESFDEVYGEICETISFPGFRKGKVPRALVAKKYGKDIVGEVKEKLISRKFYEMVEEKKLEIISQPAFDEKGKALQEGEDFSFSVSFEIKPEFELPNYKGIKLTKEVITVEDKNIEETQKNLLRSHATLQEVEGHIEASDFPVLNLDVKDESNEVLHHNHGFVCALETGRIDLFSVKGLADALRGMKKGDSIDLEHEVADPFEAKEELAGKKVTLHVEVDIVKRLVEPEFNEEFLTNLGFQSEEDYINTLKKMLENEFERLTKENLKTQIYSFLDDKVETELPSDTIERHAEYLVNTKLMELIRSGIPPQEAESKKDEFKKDSESEARKDIKVGFALNKIADKEKVLVTEREVSQRIVQLASQRGTAPETLKEELEKNHELSALRNQIKEEKTIDLLIKKAKIEEVEPKDKNEA